MTTDIDAIVSLLVKQLDDKDSYRSMTLRDYFAAKAMQAMISSNHQWAQFNVAEVAYSFADRMMEVRKG